MVGFKGTMYGKPQPVPFTRTFFCQDCSNQFRDPRVQSVLDYPPPPSAPLFWLVSRKPCMESPNQYLSPEPFFAQIAPTSFEIQGSKVCSTIRPLTLRHCFGWFQGNHVWKAPTSTFHLNVFLPGLLQLVSRSKGPKCARLSAPCHRHNKHKLGWKHEWMPTGSSGAAAVHFSASNGNIYLPLSPPPQTQAQAEAVPCERPRPWSQGAQ